MIGKHWAYKWVGQISGTYCIGNSLFSIDPPIAPIYAVSCLSAGVHPTCSFLSVMHKFSGLLHLIYFSLFDDSFEVGFGIVWRFYAFPSHSVEKAEVWTRSKCLLLRRFLAHISILRLEKSVILHSLRKDRGHSNRSCPVGPTQLSQLCKDVPY